MVGKMIFLIAENANLLQGNILLEEMSKFLAFSSPLGLKRRGQKSTPAGGNKATSKEGKVLVRKGIHGI